MPLIKDLTDDELIDEYHVWNHKIISARHWGASLGAAEEFRYECFKELQRRGIADALRS
jgi:hypothetical protein